MVINSEQKSFEISNSLQQEFEDLCKIYRKIELADRKEVVKLLENDSNPSKKRIAVMIELLRREDAELDYQLRNYLFTVTPVSEMI